MGIFGGLPHFTNVQAHYQVMYGTIKVEWKKIIIFEKIHEKYQIIENGESFQCLSILTDDNICYTREFTMNESIIRWWIMAEIHTEGEKFEDLERAYQYFRREDKLKRILEDEDTK